MKRSQTKKRIAWIYAVATLLLIITLGFGTTVLAVAGVNKGMICEGVSVSGIDLSGKSVKEAKKLLKKQIDGLMTKKVVFEIVSKGETKGTEEITLSELGFEATGEEVIEEVVSIGTRGNLIERYKEIKDTKENGVEHQLEFSYDESKLEGFVEEIKEKYQVEAEDASLKREGGAFVVLGGKTGYSLDKEKMLSDMKTVVDHFVAGLPTTMNDDTGVQAELKVVKPKYDKEDLAMVKDLLGTYTTSFGGAVTGRTLNIANGCKLINGTLIMPGESMSANKKMSPYTLANGYHLGGAYLNGKVVEDVGGGICQVSTTLYNASLYAEIGIEARQNHSMTVAYVPLARDAAIAGDFKDLVIKNNREYPIYVEGITHGGKITFNIYGHETRDANRKVDFETVTLQSIAPGKEIVTEDPNQPEDYVKINQNAWMGYKTELYKIVKVNGVQTERTLVNKSNYKATPAYVTKGTKKVEKKDEKNDKKKKPKKTSPEEEEGFGDDEFEEIDEDNEE